MRHLSARDRPASTMRVAILGLTFKENVPDIRNSKVPDIVEELASFGVAALVHDPLADPVRVRRELRIDLADWTALGELDALVLAVPHRAYLERPLAALCGLVASDGIVFDVKGVLDRGALPERLIYWSL